MELATENMHVIVRVRPTLDDLNDVCMELPHLSKLTLIPPVKSTLDLTYPFLVLWHAETYTLSWLQMESWECDTTAYLCSKALRVLFL